MCEHALKARERCLKEDLQKMTQYGYLIDTVRVHVFRDPSDELPLDELPDGKDLHPELTRALRRLKSQSDPLVDEKNGRAFAVTRASASDRSVFVEGETGRFGSTGATTHVDTGARRPFGEREASMTSKRSMFWLPSGGSLGLLFSERVGNSHLSTHLDKEVLKPLGHELGVGIKLASFVDVEAWERYVEESEGVSVKSIWRPRTLERQVTGDRRDEGELRMSLSGGAAAEVARSLRGYLREKFANGQARGIEVQVPESLRPYNEDEFSRRRVEVSLDGPEGRRTLIIERDRPPAFIYPLAGRLTRGQLREAWQAETGRLAEFYGPAVLPSWET